MEPRIQYARASDGVNVAYWTYGKGPPLVVTPLLPVGHAQLEWRAPEIRAWYERLGEGRTLIGYNSRGSGLSDRDPEDYSQGAHARDIEAVVNAAGLQTFDLFGVLHATVPSIVYAVANPGRVKRLVLWGPYPHGTDYSASPRIQASRALLAKDWDAYVETFALFSIGWSSPESARPTVDLIRESMTQEQMLRAVRELDSFDVTELAPRVSVPTLVMQARAAPWPPPEAPRRVSALIPGAQLLIVDGERVLPWGNDEAAILRAVDDFLAEAEDASPAPAATESTAESAGLTPRETELLRLLARGESNKEIAGELSLSVHTVERHLANIYAKIGARGRTDAAAYAIRNGLT